MHPSRSLIKLIRGLLVTRSRAVPLLGPRSQRSPGIKGVGLAVKIEHTLPTPIPAQPKRQSRILFRTIQLQQLEQGGCDLLPTRRTQAEGEMRILGCVSTRIVNYDCVVTRASFFLFLSPFLSFFLSFLSASNLTGIVTAKFSGIILCCSRGSSTVQLLIFVEGRERP